MPKKLRILLWNLLMVSVVLLPSFFIILAVELTLRGVSLGPSVFYQTSAAIVAYIGLWPSMAAGSVIHSLTLMFLPTSLGFKTKKSAGYVLSFVVPGVAMLLEPGIRIYLSSSPTSTVIATLAYAYGSTHVFMKYSTPNHPK